MRAIVMDERDRLLLVQLTLSPPPQGVERLWAAPGGGVEGDEDDAQALVRELDEEVGLRDPAIGPLIWTRTHILPMATGHDGQEERFYLVRTPVFEARPALSADELRAENVTGVRWWTVDELATADTVFAPRRLPALVAALLTEGPPRTPIDTGV